MITLNSRNYHNENYVGAQVQAAGQDGATQGKTGPDTADVLNKKMSARTIFLKQCLHFGGLTSLLRPRCRSGRRPSPPLALGPGVAPIASTT